MRIKPVPMIIDNTFVLRCLHGFLPYSKQRIVQMIKMWKEDPAFYEFQAGELEAIELLVNTNLNLLRESISPTVKLICDKNRT